MRLLALLLLTACSSGAREEPSPPLPKRAVGKLPPSAFDVRTVDEAAGLRDNRTTTTFCLKPEDRAELSVLPCAPTAGASTCVWRKLHTEVTVTIGERGAELFVTVVENEYDNCLFEGCR